MHGKDLEIFREIPGYKAILKAVLKSQIQVLVEQLSQQTGEESVLITASLEEGSLSYLGSEFGKVFLEGHDEFKSQFLGFCLKRYQVKKKTQPYTAETMSRKRGPRSYKFPRVSLIDEPEGSGASSTVSTSLNLGPYHVSMTKSTETGTNEQPNVTNTTELSEQNKAAPLTEQDQMNLTHNQSKVLSHSDIADMGNTAANAPRQVKWKALSVADSSNSGTCMNTDTMNEVRVKIEANDEDYEIIQSTSETQSDHNLPMETTTTYGECKLLQESGFNTLSECILANNRTIGNMKLADGDLSCVSDDHSEVNGNHTEEVLNDFSTFQSQSVMADVGLENESLFSSVKLNKCSTPIWNRKIKTFPSKPHSLKPENPLKCKPKQESDWKSYIYMDNMERPYPCNACPKRFKERHHLIYHLRTHSGQKPYVCDICNKAFSQSSSMNTHKKIHFKDLYCRICLQTFKKEMEYYGHACFQLTADVQKEMEYTGQNFFQVSADVKADKEYYGQNYFEVSADV